MERIMKAAAFINRYWQEQATPGGLVGSFHSPEASEGEGNTTDRGAIYNFVLFFYQQFSSYS